MLTRSRRPLRRQLPLLVAVIGLSACSLRQRACAERPDKTVLVPRASSSSGGLTDVPYKNPVTCRHEGQGTDYPVGPGQKYESVGDVPWEKLAAGDTVRIHHRPAPYREKIMVSGVGRADAPIRVCGVAGPNGELPIIDGEGATTRPSMDFPYDGHQVRGLVIVGKKHSSPYREQPEHIVVEGLEIRNAGPPHSFTDREGKKTPWAENAAGIFVQRASHLTIRACIIHDNMNGLFVGTSGAEELTTDVTIEGNYVYANASTENYYQHNAYNESSGIVYQFNRFGPPKSGPQGVLGANIKERSAGVVIRYNWIEDGAHLIDLVDSQEARDPNVADKAFHESFVYGNVLVRGAKASGSMVHYGGDSGVFETYRKGTLRFFHNTVVVLNASHADYETTQLFELSTNDENLVATNNVFFTEAKGVYKREVTLLGARDGVVLGVADLAGNWFSEGITAQQQLKAEQRGTVKGFDGAAFGAQPGFVDLAHLDLAPAASSPLTNGAAALELAPPHDLTKQYVLHGTSAPRGDTPRAVGAFAAK
ncbi:MAG: right-handed parallel beta-helix repeat-containing protein [Myxococcales bacterium]|nr:right-handed parallel beta-helix repeat-containing protein [Myxococcales bacterium]